MLADEYVRILTEHSFNRVFAPCKRGLGERLHVHTAIPNVSLSQKQSGVFALNLYPGAGIVQLVVLGLAVHSVAGSILLWGHFPVEGIFPLEYKPRSSLCIHAFHRTDSKDPDVHVLDG